MRRLALLLPLLALGAASRAGFRLEEALPGETLFFCEIPSVADFREAFRKSRLQAFLDDEEIRAFGRGTVEALRKGLEGARREVEKETGLSLDDIARLPSGQAALAVRSLSRGEPPGPDVVLSIDCPGRREAALKIAGYLRGLYERASGAPAETWKAGDVEVARGEFGPGLEVHLAVAGDTLLAATARATMEEILVRRAPQSLAGAERFREARRRAGAREAFFYVDLAGLARQAERFFGESERKILHALGLQGFTYACGGLTLGPDRALERIFLGAGPERRGLARFLSLKGPAPGFDAAPAGALAFVSLSVDAAELYDTFLEVLKSAHEAEAARAADAIDEVERQAGISLKNDLFAAFGPRVWAYSTFPPHGLIPEAVTCFEIRDAERFDKCLQAALRNLSAELGEVSFEGKSIRYLRFPRPPDLPDEARAFLSTVYFLRDGDRLYTSGGASLPLGFGGANALKRHLRRASAPRLSDAPAIRQGPAANPGGASLLAYFDLEQAFRAAYDALAPFAFLFRDTLFQGSGLELLKLPRGETLGRHLGQTIHLAVVEPGGLRVDTHSAAGIGLMAAVYAASAAAVAVPAATRARESARLSECQAQCSAVSFALASYHAEHGKYPDGTGPAMLKQLRDAQELDEDPRCPSAGTPSFRGPARDINLLEDGDVIFCDEPLNHPDRSINVLRKNGKVETLRPGTPEYEKALRTTKGN
jgi:hypothetical protein